MTAQDEHEYDDVVDKVRTALTRRLLELHADPGGEWRSTVGPINVFMGLAVSKLAILTGERDGLADLMAGGADPEVFDDAAAALTTIWQMLMEMTVAARA